MAGVGCTRGHERQQSKTTGQKTLKISGQRHGAMGADDFRDYMPPFLFLRSISDNYHAATK